MGFGRNWKERSNNGRRGLAALGTAGESEAGDVQGNH